MKDVYFNESTTMHLIGKSSAILAGTTESQIIADVLQAYELDNKEVVILSKSDIISLCNNIYIAGALFKRFNNGKREKGKR